jgi:hypothetical protein
MKTAEVPLTASELKFLIDLLWGAPISTVKASASRHGIDDADNEGHLPVRWIDPILLR